MVKDLKYTVGRNLVITDREPRNDEEALIIKCGNAFAPSHPTTELCLKLMERAFSTRAINSILDVGCGSGILALAGLKLGAERAVALDISRAAISASKINIRRNKLEGNSDLILGSVDCIKGRFDLIVANLHLSTLLELANNFKKALGEGGTLIVSGFYDIEFYHLDSALSDIGFRCGDMLLKDHVMVDLPPSMSSTFGAAEFFPSGGALP